MLRSFSYAAYSGLEDRLGQDPDPAEVERLTAWAVLWERSVTCEFLRSYRDQIAENPDLLPGPDGAQALLDAYVLEKALYEVRYELDHRPAWLRIPLAGILAL